MLWLVRLETQGNFYERQVEGLVSLSLSMSSTYRESEPESSLRIFSSDDNTRKSILTHLLPVYKLILRYLEKSL